MPSVLAISATVFEVDPETEAIFIAKNSTNDIASSNF